MALSLGDVFLNFTAGAVERNNHQSIVHGDLA